MLVSCPGKLCEIVLFPCGYWTTGLEIQIASKYNTIGSGEYTDHCNQSRDWRYSRPVVRQPYRFGVPPGRGVDISNSVLTFPGPNF